jgi:hypothetical protein
MALYVFCIMLMPFVEANDANGHFDCPCITPSQQSNWCDASHRAMHGGSCYPQSYGAGTCATHDAGITQECVSDEQCTTVGGSAVDCASNKLWCDAKWCWVDHNACSAPHSTSSFFPNTSLHYSFETCGNLNEYDPHKFEHFLTGVTSLRICFPGSSGSGYTIVRDGPPGYQGLDVNNGTKRKFGQFGRLGSTVDFFDRVWKEFGRKEYTVVRVSPSSEARYPQSSFTACIHELALGWTDACIGNFWPTPDRRLLATFTSAIYQDTFHLVVRKEVKDDDVGADMLSKPFALFSVTE